ncbi:uncharacterized protein MELLADRAFT_71407 [Melampsora larici-populina 98AG31]|uniref:F-box domain-containing protein n=1 Tax=Melampsora larici-populina (strain 98AG31 / pathotype 3-4-7) TaxID=747676 RepID=F4RFZ6_MELLP|nr:uncharacterized protein MELLADRAFT_71407 [Melampsora larici-populina 98AG31]EGG08461.1 hypothetical protein MELLADRAFT_71407 [Melampsora larici-populina 98AG31]
MVLSPFQDFNFKGFEVDRVNFTFDNIIKKHLDHVKWIKWNVPKQMPNLSVEPISRLTGLTHLCLTSSPMVLDKHSYTERFIVDLISKLPRLQSFTCSEIVATHPNPWDGTKDGPDSHSPLGIHLASLTDLTELELEEVQCLDASWNQHKWSCSLTSLSLIDCERVSASVLHGLVNLFKSSLTTLIFYNVDLHYRPTLKSQSILEDIKNDNFKFELPGLTTLEISSCLPLQFLKSFRHSKNLSWLLISDNTFYKNQDLGDIIQLQLWPNLKTFEIKNGSPFLSYREVEELKVVCQQHTIELVVDSFFYFDEYEVPDPY